MKLERKTVRFGLTLAGIAAGTAILAQVGPAQRESPAPASPPAPVGTPVPVPGFDPPETSLAADTRVVYTPSGGRVVILGRSAAAAAPATLAGGGAWAADPGAGRHAAIARPPVRTRRS